MAEWSESALLQGVSRDASIGFIVGIDRFPGRRTASVWAWAFLPGEVYGYVEEGLPDSDQRLPLAPTEATYDVDVPGTAARLSRILHEGSTRGGRAFARVGAHGLPDGAAGLGPIPLAVGGTMATERTAGFSMNNRVQVLGAVTGSIEVARRGVQFRGYGYWRERRDATSRYDRPFTYASLCGDELALVAVATPTWASGFACRSGLVPVEGFEVDALAPERRLRVYLDDGSRIEGRAEAQHQFSIPAGGQRLCGQLVTFDTAAFRLAGVIYDWEPQPAGPTPGC